MLSEHRVSGSKEKAFQFSPQSRTTDTRRLISSTSIQDQGPTWYSWVTTKAALSVQLFWSLFRLRATAKTVILEILWEGRVAAVGGQLKFLYKLITSLQQIWLHQTFGYNILIREVWLVLLSH